MSGQKQGPEIPGDGLGRKWRTRCPQQLDTWTGPLFGKEPSVPLTSAQHVDGFLDGVLNDEEIWVGLWWIRNDLVKMSFNYLLWGKNATRLQGCLRHVLWLQGTPSLGRR